MPLTNKPQKLYHQTLAIRPKLIKLIEKYSQKKGEQATTVFYLDNSMQYMLTTPQTTSPSSTKSSSRPAATTRPCSNHPCPTRHSPTTSNMPCTNTSTPRATRWALAVPSVLAHPISRPMRATRRPAWSNRSSSSSSSRRRQTRDTTLPGHNVRVSLYTRKSVHQVARTQ